MSDSVHVKTYVTWTAPSWADQNTVYVLVFVATRKEPTYVTQVIGVTHTEVLLLWEEDYHCEVFIQWTFDATPKYSRHSSLDFRTPNEFE